MDIPYYAQTCISKDLPDVPFLIRYEDLFFDELYINHEQHYFDYRQFIHSVAISVGEKEPTCNHTDFIKFINRYVKKKKIRLSSKQNCFEMFNCAVYSGSTKRLNIELEKMRKYFIYRLIYLTNLPNTNMKLFSIQQKTILDYIENSEMFYIPVLYQTSKTVDADCMESKYKLIAKLMSQTWNYEISVAFMEDSVYTITIRFIQPIEQGRKQAEIFLPKDEMLSLLKERSFKKDSFLIKDNFVYHRRINFCEL